MAKNENKVDNKVKKHFFKDFKAELKRVIWPTPKQLVNNTTAVVTIVIITAIIVIIATIETIAIIVIIIATIQIIIETITTDTTTI